MIYELIEEQYFNNGKLFPEEFLQKCKNYYNEPQFITNISRNKFKTNVLNEAFLSGKIYQTQDSWRNRTKIL